jgi:hypothetical protein
MWVTGLPYTAAATPAVFPAAVLPSSITFTGAVGAAALAGNSYVNLYRIQSDTGVNGLAMDTEGTIWCTGTYETNQ